MLRSITYIKSTSYHGHHKRRSVRIQMDLFGHLFFVFASYSLIFTVCGQGPELVIVPDSLSVQYASSVAMSCVAADGGGSLPSISWSLNGHVIESTSINITISSRIISEHNLMFVQSTLHVCPINFNKTGLYSCIALNSGGTASETWTVNITGAQSSDLVLAPQNQIISYGESIVMLCMAYDSPLPNITFVHNGIILDNATSDDVIFSTVQGVNFTSSTLLLCNPDFTNVGEYSCVASNGLGNADIHTWNISFITDPSPPEITDISGNQTVDYRGSTTMSCTATGFPLPTITYTLNGEQVRNSSTVTVTKNNVTINNISAVQSTITISAVGANHIGLYVCSAMNDQGVDSRYWNLSLTISLAPEIVIRPLGQISIDYQDTVIMSCSAYGFPMPTISYTRNSIPVSGSESHITLYSRVISNGGIEFVDSRLVICGLGAEDGGVYECEATNPFGASTFTWQLDIIRAPPPLTTTPEHSTTTLESPTLTVHTSGPTTSESYLPTTSDTTNEPETRPTTSEPDSPTTMPNDIPETTTGESDPPTTVSNDIPGSNSGQQVTVIGGSLGGIVVLLILLFIVVLVIALCFVKLKRRKKKYSIDQQQKRKKTGSVGQPLPLVPPSPNDVPPEPPAPYDDPYDEKEEYKPLTPEVSRRNEVNERSFYDNDDDDIVIMNMHTSEPVVQQNQAYMSTFDMKSTMSFQSQDKFTSFNKKGDKMKSNVQPAQHNKADSVRYVRKTFINHSPASTTCTHEVDDEIYENAYDAEVGQITTGFPNIATESDINAQDSHYY